MTPFIPHKFEPKIEVSSIPSSVSITPMAYAKMVALVDEVSDEVGWFGTVVREENDYLVKDIFIPNQTVSGAETNVSTEGLAQLTQELIASDPTLEIVNNLRLWGHSHPRFDTSPSGEDLKQIKEFEEIMRSGNCEFFLCCIGNKNGKLCFNIHDYRYNIDIWDAPWSIKTPEVDIAAFKAQITEKVKPHSYASTKGSTVPAYLQRSGFGYGYGYDDDYSGWDGIHNYTPPYLRNSNPYVNPDAATGEKAGSVSRSKKSPQEVVAEIMEVTFFEEDERSDIEEFLKRLVNNSKLAESVDTLFDNIYECCGNAVFLKFERKLNRPDILHVIVDTVEDEDALFPMNEHKGLLKSRIKLADSRTTEQTPRPLAARSELRNHTPKVPTPHPLVADRLPLPNIKRVRIGD